MCFCSWTELFIKHIIARRKRLGKTNTNYKKYRTSLTLSDNVFAPFFKKNKKTGGGGCYTSQHKHKSAPMGQLLNNKNCAKYHTRYTIIQKFGVSKNFLFFFFIGEFWKKLKTESQLLTFLALIFTWTPAELSACRITGSYETHKEVNDLNKWNHRDNSLKNEHFVISTRPSFGSDPILSQFVSFCAFVSKQFLNIDIIGI